MLIKLGIKLFFKKFFLSLIIILQISVTVLLTNLIVGSYNLIDEAFALTNNFPEQKTYFVMPGFDGYNLTARIERTQELFDKYKNEILVEQVLARNIQSDDNQSYLTISYGKKTSEYLNMPLKNGCWYTEAESGDYVPCVIKGAYSVGDIIRLPITYEQNKNQGEQASEEDMLNHPELKQEDKTNPVYITFRVCGLLKENYRILTFATSSNNLMLEHLFDKITDMPVILFNQEDLKKFNVVTGYSLGTNSMLYMQTDNPETKQQIVDEFKEQAWIVPYEQAHSESKYEFFKKLKILLPLMISILFVGLISALCITLLNAYNHIRVFSIYYICGMNWKSSFLIILSYVMCHVISSILVFLGFVLLLKNELSTGMYIFNSLNIFSSVAIFVIMTIVSLMAPYFLLKKEQPLKQLKQGW